LAFYVLALLFPTVTGPLAGYAFVKGLLSRNHLFGWLFWPGLVLLHLLGFFFLTGTVGEHGVGPGFVASLVTPAFAAAAALALRFVYRRLSPTALGDPGQRRRFKLGNLILPLLQVVTVSVVIILAPGR
jgi:hypothetical protein